MSKLALMAKNALTKIRVSPQMNNYYSSSRFLIQSSFRRSFSTEGEVPEPKVSYASPDPEGKVFGKVKLTAKNLLKTDMIHYFEGCNLSNADVKVKYNYYIPTHMMLQFSSQAEYDSALKQTVRKGRLYQLERTDRSEFELLQSYDGKSVLLEGLPRNAIPEDVDRFLSGTNFDPSFQLFLRPVGSLGGVIKCAVVRFATAIDAMCAFTTKNNSFCLNRPVRIRVLQ